MNHTVYNLKVAGMPQGLVGGTFGDVQSTSDLLRYPGHQARGSAQRSVRSQVCQLPAARFRRALRELVFPSKASTETPCSLSSAQRPTIGSPPTISPCIRPGPFVVPCCSACSVGYPSGSLRDCSLQMLVPYKCSRIPTKDTGNRICLSTLTA